MVTKNAPTEAAARVAEVAKAKGSQLPPEDEWEFGIRASYGDEAAEQLDCIPARRP